VPLATRAAQPAPNTAMDAQTRQRARMVTTLLPHNPDVDRMTSSSGTDDRLAATV
jgi:hypothetical protein